METTRTRADRCPGIFRPWPADDGLLVRLRLIGGRIAAATLSTLVGIAEEYGDGRVHLTVRANLQLRALPGADGMLDPVVREALLATGLVPSRAHDLVRNVLVSPQTGLSGGRADLRPVAAELDERVRSSAPLAELPARFLFVLDDGRGDLVGHVADLGLVALDATTVQLRVGESWGRVVALDEAAALIVDLAERFVASRGVGPGAAWHVVELTDALVAELPADPRIPPASGPLRFGSVPGGIHVAVGESGIDRTWLDGARHRTPWRPDHELVITPWKGVLIPTYDEVNP
jgi:precorrin-3B synthase